MDALIELFSNPKQTQIVLQNVANYVTYIYPGIISIYWNNFLEAKSTKDTQALIVKSFSISFLYNIAFNTIFSAIDFYINIIEYNIWLITVAILCPYCYNKLKFSKISNVICEFLGIRTCISGVPFELLKTEAEKYTWLKIYLTDNATVYVGYMEQYEYEESKERFVILTGYKKYIISSNKEKIVIDNEADRHAQKVFIKYSEIKVIEKIAEDIATNTIYKKDKIKLT